MAYKVYDVTKTALSHDGYQVKINDCQVTLDTARVSAMPFNRRWPGHQRQIEQSELVNFLRLATDEPLHFAVTPAQPFTDVVIRPHSLGIKPEIKDGTVYFTLEKPAYFTLEPYGRKNALHIFADPMPRYDIGAGDENVLYFGRGEHDVGLITLQSDQTLFLDEGAVVYASVEAKDARNICICGRGILDNSRNVEQILFEANEEGNAAAVNNAIRRHTVQLEYCDGVTIEGITIRDSLVYNIRPVGCKDLDISNVKIIGCWRYNSDGIDMHNCVNVRIDNCFLRTYDDSICVKGFDFYFIGEHTPEEIEALVHDCMYRNGKAYDVFDNTKITRCVIWNDWGRCLEIGAETRAEEIKNILFEDCDVIHVTHNVLDCQNVDYADVHDLVYRNIRVEQDEIIPLPSVQITDADKYVSASNDFSPPVISAFVQFHPEYSAGGKRRGHNHHILFEDIYLYGWQKPQFHFAGYSEEYNCEDITIRNIYHNDRKISAPEDYSLVQNEYCKNITLEL